jgi:hypothetical protein
MALSLANSGAFRALGLKILWVQGKGGRTDPRSGLGRPAWADRPRLISARFGRPFAPVGRQVIMHFAPSTCMILTKSSSPPRWRFSAHEVRSFTLQSRGCSYLALRSLPPLEVIYASSWTRTWLYKMLHSTCCESILYVHVFLYKPNTSKCMHIDELVIWVVCLVAG